MTYSKLLDYVSDWEADEIRREVAAGDDPKFVAFRHGIPNGVITKVGMSRVVEPTCEWDEESDEFLRANYPTRGKSWDGWKGFGKPWRAIQLRAQLLGISAYRSPAQRKPVRECKRKRLWTEDELQFIRANYPYHGESWPEWKRLDRTWKSIKQRACHLGVHATYRSRRRLQ